MTICLLGVGTEHAMEDGKYVSGIHCLPPSLIDMSEVSAYEFKWWCSLFTLENPFIDSQWTIDTADKMVVWRQEAERIDEDACLIISGHSAPHFEMAPSMSVNLISLVTFCVGLREEEPQIAHPMSFTWGSLMALKRAHGMLNSTRSITWCPHYGTYCN